MKQLMLLVLLIAVTPTKGPAPAFEEITQPGYMRSFTVHRLVSLEKGQPTADTSGMCWPIPQPLICQKDPLPPL